MLNCYYAHADTAEGQQVSALAVLGLMSICERLRQLQGVCGL